MPRTPIPPSPLRLVVVLLAFFGGAAPYLEAMAVEVFPAAPTIPDAHRYFGSLVAGNSVVALDETRSQAGEYLGYESIPVAEYSGARCNSTLVLKNDVKIDIDWRVIDKSHASDATVNIFSGQEIQFQFFHMVSIEGGIAVQPSTRIPHLILGVAEEVSRNRLLNAIELIATACRSVSKFD